MKKYEAKFGAKTVTFFPLTLKQIRDLGPKLEDLRNTALTPAALMKDPQVFDRILDLFVEGAKRADPSITKDDVAAVVDMENMFDILEVMISMRIRRPTAEDLERPTSPQIGGESTPPSPAPPDGGSATSTS